MTTPTLWPDYTKIACNGPAQVKSASLPVQTVLIHAPALLILNTACLGLQVTKQRTSLKQNTHTGLMPSYTQLHN